MKIRCLLVVGGLATSLAGQPNASEGLVAYVREGREIRLVAPDGTNDRLLWTHPLARADFAIRGVHSLAWHPRGESLAFSSDHESAYSYYDYDVYSIALNGTPPRRLTNTPDRAELARFPKGEVSVTVENRQFRSPGAPFSRLSSLFFVYVAGAEKSQMVAIAPGFRKTLVFDVAKYTDGPQPVVVIDGLKRWPGAPIRVQPGLNINVTLAVTNFGLESFGAFSPAWSSDGARVAYRMGLCTGIYSVPAAPAPGGIDKAVAATGKDRPACVFDWAPAGVEAPPILFAGWLAGGGETDNSIYQTDEAGARIVRLVHFASSMERITAVRWLADGSGFLFTREESRDFAASANLYRYDFRSRTVAPLTRLREQHVRSFAVSPDGRQVIYERGKQIYFPGDSDRPALWLITVDGAQERRLIANGSSPAWGRASGSQSRPTASAPPIPAPGPVSPPAAVDLSARSMEAANAANRRDYDSAVRIANEVLRADPGRKEALFALAASAYGTADFDRFEQTAPAAIRSGAGMSFNLLHHHTLTGGHPATLGIKQSAIPFDPMNAKDCNQRAFDQSLTTIVSAVQTATAGGEIFLALKMRDAQGKARTLNFADPGSMLDKSGGLPVLRPPADAARRLRALANVINAVANSPVSVAAPK